MSNSTVFTIGSALRQAENDGSPVGLMVDGQWFAGAIGGLDGDGVLLEAEDGTVTIRLTAISVVRAIKDASAAPRTDAQPSIAPVLSLTRAEEPAAEEPAETLPTVAEQLAAQSDEPETVEAPADEQVAVEEVTVGQVAVEDEPIDDPMAQLALIEEDLALLDHLPDDVTDDERYALAKRRALMAQKAAAAFADPAAIVAGLTGTALDAPEPVPAGVSPIEVGRIDLAPVAEQPVTEEPVAEEPVAEEPVAEEPLTEQPVTEEPPTLEHLSPAEPLRLDLAPEAVATELDLHPVEEIALVEAAMAAEHAANPLVHSSTQTDDWRAMLVSLRQQAAETPQTTEPEKRRSWRLAR